MSKQGKGVNKNPAIITLMRKSAQGPAQIYNIHLEQVPAGKHSIDLGDGTHCEFSYEGDTLCVHTTGHVDIQVNGDLFADAVSIETLGRVTIDSDMVLEPKYGMNIQANNITLNAAITTEGLLSLSTTDPKFNHAVFTGAVTINKPMAAAYASILTDVICVNSIAKINKLSTACERLHVEAKSNLLVGTEAHINNLMQIEGLDEVAAAFIEAVHLMDQNEQSMINTKYMLVTGSARLRNTHVTAHECVIDHSIILDNSTLDVGYMINFRHGLMQMANTVIRSKDILIGKSAELYGMLIRLIAQNDIKVEGEIAIPKAGQVKERISLILAAGNDIIVPGNITVAGSNRDEDAIDGYEKTTFEEKHKTIPDILFHAGYRIRITGCVIAERIALIAHHLRVLFGAYLQGFENVTIHALSTCIAFARLRSTNIVVNTGLYISFLSLVRSFNFFTNTLIPANIGVSIFEYDIRNIRWRSISNKAKLYVAARFVLLYLFKPLGLIVKFLSKLYSMYRNGRTAYNKANQAYNNYYYPKQDPSMPAESPALNALDFVLAVKQVLFAGSVLYNARDFMHDCFTSPQKVIDNNPIASTSKDFKKVLGSAFIAVIPSYVNESVFSFRAGVTLTGSDAEENAARRSYAFKRNLFPGQKNNQI